MPATEDFRPTLLVGVGGTGCDIAQRVYAEALAGDAKLKGRLGVLAFDTDTNDMRRMRAIEDREKVTFSTADTVYQLLDKNPEVERSWFGPRKNLSQDILNLTLLDGAAQIRLLTRLGLQHVAKRGEIDRRIGDAIGRIAVLNSRDKFEGAVNVMLVGSLAGATGSGSFMQVALGIAAVCKARNISADVRGLFILPDVFVRGASLPTAQIQNVLANGYASLKELNAVNNLVNERGDRTNFEFEYLPGHRLEQGGTPFKSVALLDFENTKGGNFGRAIDAYKYMAARATYLLLFSPIGQKAASIGVNDARSKLAAAAQGTHNLFAGIGVSAITYPAEEMRDYLVLKLTLDNLSGDWLRLDRNFQDRLRRYEEQKRAGNLSATRPDQGAEYLADLELLATKERLPFFADIHSGPTGLFRATRDENGNPVEKVQHLVYLDALVADIKDRFWSREQIKDIRARSSVDSSQLKNASTLADIVRRLENQLDDDFATLEKALLNAPEDDFMNVLVTADDMSAPEWRDHHIQAHLIKDGPHLVQVRAFLYALRRSIDERLGRLDVPGWRTRVLRQSNIWDDKRPANPVERRAPAVLEKARAAASPSLLDRVTGAQRKFQEDYSSYYNGSLNAMRNYANQAIEARVLSLLRDEVEALERTLAGLFVELQAIFQRLSEQAEAEERRHGGGGLIDGNLWVYADAPAKQEMWRDLSAKAAGLRLDAEANRALSGRLYRQFRKDRRDRRVTDIAKTGEIFRDALIGDFARKTVEQDFSATYQFSVVEATKREAALRKAEWQAHLRSLVDLAGSQAEPFLTLTDSSDGQVVKLWAVNSKLREEVNDDAMFSALFTFDQGEAPMEGAEFDNRSLLCMNSRVNLELQHLAKLYPGDETRRNVNVPGVGRYFDAYAKLVDNLVEADLAGAAARDFTPHIDIRWHRPGALPELFPHLSRKLQVEVARGCVVALADGLLREVTTYGEDVTEFDTIGRVSTGGTSRELTRSHDRWTVIRAFAAQPELARAALRYWDEAVAALRAGRRKPDTLARIAEPTFLARLLEILVDRSDAEERAERARGLVAAWIGLAGQLVGLANPELAKPGRDAKAAEIIEGARLGAMDALRGAGLREETLRDIDRTFRLGSEDAER